MRVRPARLEPRGRQPPVPGRRLRGLDLLHECVPRSAVRDRTRADEPSRQGSLGPQAEGSARDLPDAGHLRAMRLDEVEVLEKVAVEGCDRIRVRHETRGSAQRASGAVQCLAAALAGAARRRGRVHGDDDGGAQRLDGADVGRQSAAPERIRAEIGVERARPELGGGEARLQRLDADLLRVERGIEGQLVARLGGHAEEESEGAEQRGKPAAHGTHGWERRDRGGGGHRHPPPPELQCGPRP